MKAALPTLLKVGILAFTESMMLAFIFIYHAEWEGGRIVRFLLMDDAMISLSYARSLVEGCGLIWHCSAEKVEGITNLGWTLYMAFWLWIGIPPEYAALPILLTGLLTAALHLLATYTIGKKLHDERTGLWAMGTLALLPPVWVWHSAGLETGALAVLFTYLLRESILSFPSTLRASVYVMLGTLLRMDFFLWGSGLWLTASFVQKKSLREMVPPLLTGLAVAAGQTLFRKAYYGDWVPHTYLLKVADIPFRYRWINGASCTGFHILYNLPLWGLGLYGFWRLARSHHADKWMLLAIALLLSGGYNLHAGGDMAEGALVSNRFMLPAMTTLAIGVGYALSRAPLWVGGLAVALIAHGIPLHPEGFAGRWRALLGPIKATLTQGWDERYRYFLFGKKPLPIDRYVPRGAKVVVGFAGTYAYFFRDYRWVDFFGKNDRSALTQGSPCLCGALPYEIYFPGHTRWGWHLVKDAAAIVEVVAFDDTMACKGQKPPLSCTEGLGRIVPVPHSCCTPGHPYPFPDDAVRRFVCENFRPTTWVGFWVRDTQRQSYISVLSRSLSP